MTLTIEIPSEVAERARAAGIGAEQIGASAAEGAITAITALTGNADVVRPEVSFLLFPDISLEDLEADLDATARGLGEADAGQTLTADEVFADVDAALAARTTARAGRGAAAH